MGQCQEKGRGEAEKVLEHHHVIISNCHQAPKCFVCIAGLNFSKYVWKDISLSPVSTGRRRTFPSEAENALKQNVFFGGGIFIKAQRQIIYN